MTFTFDGEYHNTEQVRPYFAAYSVVRAELDAAGKYPYNDSFKGRIPGIEGTHEDTAIYLLQRMHDLDELDRKIEAFLADGGVEITEPPDRTIRGTIVHLGFYMGGTGWHQYDQARLIHNGRSIYALPKGKRTHGHLLTGGRVLVKET